MASNLPPSSDIRILVKLAKRIVIKPKEEHLTRNLNEVYNDYHTTRNANEKRFSAKLTGTKHEMTLSKGSWWITGSPVYSLPLQNVLQFTAMIGRPAKLLLLIKNDEGTKTELIVIKTKGQAFRNQLLEYLQRNVNAAHMRLVQNSTNGKVNRESRQVTYQVVEAYSPTMNRHKASTNSPVQKRRPPPSKPVDLEVKESRRNKQQQQQQPEKIIIPQRPERVRKPIEPEPITSLNGSLNETYSRSTFDPETNVETLDSVVVYGQNSEKPSKPTTKSAKSRKSKSKPPRELSALNGGRKVSRELDENNTPWEVNICYIKHDPLVGCVEDESGPIYMYTAHQLVSRDDYDNYSSGDSDGDSLSRDSDSEDASSSDESQDSTDENKELERFMMLGGNRNVITNGTNGKNGKLSEIYEY